MEQAITLTVNGRPHAVQATAETPLLYVLRNELALNGPQFGCGLEQCGACTVLVGARAVPACLLPVGEVGRAAVTTLEGLSEDGELHPVQQAFIDEQAAQCGFCINGMMMTAAALLWKTRQPPDAQIREALEGNLCRCGAHPRILRAVRRAANILAEMEADNGPLQG